MPQQPGVSNKPPTYNELSIITERPKRPEYAKKESRLETFINWPRSHHLEPNYLAVGGFYFAGYGDCVRCFYCGGGLRNWEDEDDVFVEHARWFPKCAFVKSTCGQQFIDLVIELNKDHDQLPLDFVLSKLPKQFHFGHSITTDARYMMTDPAVKVLKEKCGYKDPIILESLEVWKERCMGTLSSDALLKFMVRDLKCDPPNKEFSDLDFDEISDYIKRENEDLRNKLMCKICMTNTVCMAFLPCGHVVSCTECTYALDKCPICRQDKKGVVRVHLAYN